VPESLRMRYGFLERVERQTAVRASAGEPPKPQAPKAGELDHFKRIPPAPDRISGRTQIPWSFRNLATPSGRLDRATEP